MDSADKFLFEISNFTFDDEELLNRGPKLDNGDYVLDVINSLTNDIKFSKNRSREKAERIIKLCKEYSITSNYFTIRGLVYWNDLLFEYLSICTRISPDDYSVAIARCIENNLSDSLDLLLAVNRDLIKCEDEIDESDMKDLISPRILIEKYPYNMKLYQKSRNSGIIDPCLEAKIRGEKVENYPLYTSEDIEQKFNLYGGYRYTYHLCMYYPKGLVCLEKRYSYNTSSKDLDCTADAICDYFKIKKSDVIEFIMNL